MGISRSNVVIWDIIHDAWTEIHSLSQVAPNGLVSN